MRAEEQLENGLEAFRSKLLKDEDTADFNGMNDSELLDCLEALEDENVQLLFEISRLERAHDELEDSILQESLLAPRTNSQPTSCSSVSRLIETLDDIQTKGVEDIAQKEELMKANADRAAQRREQLRKLRHAPTQTENAAPLVRPLLDVTRELRETVALNKEFDDMTRRDFVYKPRLTEPATAGVQLPPSIFDPELCCTQAYCIERGALLYTEALIPCEFVVNYNCLWIVTIFPQRIVQFCASFDHVPDCATLTGFSLGQCTDSFSRYTGNATVPIGMVPSKPLDSLYDSHTQADLKAHYYRSFSVEGVFRKNNQTTVTRFDCIAADEASFSRLTACLHNVMIFSPKPMFWTWKPAFHPPGVGRPSDIYRLKFKKTAQFNAETMPIIHAMSPDDATFCSHHYIHPHIFLNLKMRLLQDPAIRWISTAHLASYLLIPPHAKFNMLQTTAVLTYFVDKRWISPVAVIERVPSE